MLCVRLDATGDVLMTTPAIRAVKQASPLRRVTLLTSPAGAAVAPLVPEIDDVLVHEASWMKAGTPDADGACERALVALLRAARFDAAVLFTVYSQSPLPAALLCRLADVPLRAAHCRENPYRLLTDWIPEREPHALVRHEVRRQLDLVAHVGCHTRDETLSLRVPPRALAAARARLRARRVASRWIALHPGASAPSRRYPEESFAAVVRLLVADGHDVVLVGGREERALAHRVRHAAHGGARVHVFAGDTDLAELAALLWQAPLLIANNSGPVHVAAAVGTPVVVLYALTNPQHGPWMVPQRVLSHEVSCKYCYKSVCPEGHHDCLRAIAPESVLDAARALLDPGSAARHAMPA